MKPAAFDYVRAEHLDEALGVLGREGGDARVLAGGQSLMAMLNMRLAKPRTLIDIMRLAELARIERKKDTITIGAGVRQAALQEWPDLGRDLPLVALALPWTGHVQTQKPGHRLRIDRPCRSQRRIAARAAGAWRRSASAQRQAAAARGSKGLLRRHDGDPARGRRIDRSRVVSHHCTSAAPSARWRGVMAILPSWPARRCGRPMASASRSAASPTCRWRGIIRGLKAARLTMP